MDKPQPTATADIAPAIIWMTDADGWCIYLSRQWYALTGQRPEEGLGLGWLDAVHPDDRERSSAIVLDANVRRRPFKLDYRLRRHDGEYRWAIDAGQPRFSESGELLGFVGSVLDITERKQAEEALRNRERLLAYAEQIARFGSWEWHLEEGKLSSSPGLRRILECGEGEIATWNDLVGFVHAGDREGFQAAVERAVRERSRCGNEFRIVSGSGEERLLKSVVEVVVDGAGTPVRVVGTAHDVTGSRRAEKRLRESEELLQRVTATSPAVLYTLSVEGGSMRPTWVSANIEQIFGYTIQDALHPPWWLDHLHPEDREAAIGAMAALLRTGSLSHEYRFRHADGSYRWVRDQLRVVHGREESTVEIVGSWMDASDFRQLENQLRQVQKLEALGRLAGGIAHDFNNLLAAVSGFAELILEDLDASAPAARNAQEIVSLGERGANLVRQLMAFGRQQVIQPEVLELNEVVSGTVSMLRRLIGGDVDLVVDLDPAAGWVRADRGQLEQVLLNLVINARDAMPEGGRLAISTEAAAPGEVETVPGGALRGRQAVLRVADTGSGIPGDIAERIFEPFFTTKEAGTGLGLSIVYGILKQNQGEVLVDSTPGRGATFCIHLPQVEPATAPEREVCGEAEAVRGELVLLVEDQPSVRTFARQVLERAGYRVLEAAGGSEALSLYEHHADSIDLVVTDVVMPQMSGQQLAERLRSLRSDLAVLFMSGHAEGGSFDREVIGPGTYFIEKPFSIATFTRRVREALDDDNKGAGADDVGSE